MSRPAGPEVVVTGLGMLTPAGHDTATTWRTVCAGRATAAPAGALAGLPVDFACTVPPQHDPAHRIGPPARRMDRFAQFAVAAAREAVADAGLGPDRWDPARVGVVLGSSLAGVGTWEAQTGRLESRGAQYVAPLTVPAALGNMAAGHVSLDQRVHGPGMSVSTACAAGTTALGIAAELVRSGRCDVVLAGGAEAPVTRLTATAFHRLGSLSCRGSSPTEASRPFDRDRDGFVLGEGAAVLVLESARHAAARGAVPYARLLGYGAASDAHHLTTPEPGGRGAELALRQALAEAGVHPDDVAYVNAHATGTPTGDAVEARTIARVFPSRPPVSSIKGVTGHLLAGAGAVEAAVTALCVRHGVVPPNANLADASGLPDLDLPTARRESEVPVAVSQSFGFGGHNAVIVLGAP